MNIDSYDGLSESAEEINDASVATLFQELAAERSTLSTAIPEDEFFFFITTSTTVSGRFTALMKQGRGCSRA